MNNKQIIQTVLDRYTRAYNNNELHQYHKQLREIDQQSKQDKAEARADMLNWLNNDAAHFGERAGWILNGSYGYGPFYAALQILNMSERANKRAALFGMLAALECRVNQRDANAIYNKLTGAQQAALNAAIQKEIDDFIEEWRAELESQAQKQDAEIGI